MKLMLVDDNPAMRRMLRAIAAEADDTVVECDDGAEVLAAYLAHKFGPADCVLMDVRMRVVGGIQATLQLKAHCPEARVLIVTNFDDPAIRRAALQAGASAFITKDDLLAVREWLRPRAVQP